MPFEALRFIHASATLIDHPLRDLRPVTSRQRQSLLDSATKSFERIIEACVEQQVDFLLLTGDTFDDRDGSLKARVAIREGFECLNEHGIQAFVIPGTADPASAWQSFPGLPDNVTLFIPEVDEPTAILRDGNVIATLQACLNSGFNANLNYGGHEDHSVHGGPFRIGIIPPGRTGEGGNTGLAIENWLAQQAVDYLAIGRPFPRSWITRGDRVAYAPGPAVSYSRQDSGPLGCSLITVEDRGAVQHELLTTSPVRREKITWHIHEQSTWDELIAGMRQSLEALSDLEQATVLAIDWHIAGAGTLHDSLADPESSKELFELLEADGTVAAHSCLFHRLVLEATGGFAPAGSDSAETVWESDAAAWSQASTSEPLGGANPFSAGLIRRLDTEHSLVNSVLGRLRSSGQVDAPWLRRLEMLAERVDDADVRARARHMSRQWFAGPSGKGEQE